MFGNNYSYGNYDNGGFNWRLLLGIIIAVVSVIAYFSHVSVNPVTGEKQHLHMTQAQETQLGLASAPQMEAQFNGEVPRDDVEAEEVRYIGKRLSQTSEARQSGYNYQYHLLADTNTVNAFALPGGQVFITKALYERLADEAELAGVLGHETGHVIQRHSAQQVEKSQLGSRLAMAVGVGSRNGFSSYMIANVVDQVAQLHFSREDENQADSWGIRLMPEIGFDPRGMLDVMKVLMEVNRGGREPEFLVTHPYPQTRMVTIKSQLQAMYPDGIPAELGRGRALPRD
jgi:predicted Zn-dependent protease